MRAVSAPNLLMIALGSTTFPRDLDIAEPPRVTIPCARSRSKGSSL